MTIKMYDKSLLIKMQVSTILTDSNNCFSMSCNLILFYSIKVHFIKIEHYFKYIEAVENAKILLVYKQYTKV